MNDDEQYYEERAELALANGDLPAAAGFLQRAGYYAEAREVLSGELTDLSIQPNRPRGTFYDKTGAPRPHEDLWQSTEPPTKDNQYGWFLNAYGEQGNRALWLTYTPGARQAF